MMGVCVYLHTGIYNAKKWRVGSLHEIYCKA